MSFDGRPFDPSSLPIRVEPKTIVVPSHESDARVSLAELLIGASKWTGSDQLSARLSRLAVQISGPPSVKGRVESNTISRPLWRTFGRESSFAVLRVGLSCAGPKSTLKYMSES